MKLSDENPADELTDKLCILELEGDLESCEDCQSEVREPGDDDSALDAQNEGADL